ncbi:hypothetical protein [Microtetraspora sp. NBRC 16547]|uniref:hypothetical protein n=1 Tax=Microtetraspora sp. NBRC 16547 TaxID=3030993 RepID=UPI0024A2B741|nr:hypothetical protein [Microtetraspora sp. NBRC 16547]GLX01202.1 hypothetical protein Misp02_52880 [Microtetraspora sp. NBRC 16547]
MTTLERCYRRLLLAYPRSYRAAHGDELLDVLLESARPGQSVPVFREALGLIFGGARARIAHLATGSTWADGVHLGITAVSVANLAALLPYAGAVPWWTLLSALALLAILRGQLGAAFALTALTGAKSVAIAGGWQVFDLTLVPVSPTFLTRDFLFERSSPFAVACAFAVALLGLLVLIRRGGPVRVRSWWWWAAVPPIAWAGPAWMPDGTPYPISLSRLSVEVGVFALAVVGAYLARDLRWALASGIYLLAASGELNLRVEYLTRQHLAYWSMLVLLTLGAAIAPYRPRRHLLD